MKKGRLKKGIAMTLATIMLSMFVLIFAESTFGQKTQYKREWVHNIRGL